MITQDKENKKFNIINLMQEIPVHSKFYLLNFLIIFFDIVKISTKIELIG